MYYQIKVYKAMCPACI